MISGRENYLYGSFRYIEYYDLQKRFKSSDPTIDRYKLNYYFEENNKKNCASIVMYIGNEKNYELACISLIYVDHDIDIPVDASLFSISDINKTNSLHIDLLATNEYVKKYDSEGNKLNYGISMVLNIIPIARNLNKKYVWLKSDSSKSTEKLKNYYRKMLSFKNLLLNDCPVYEYDFVDIKTKKRLFLYPMYINVDEYMEAII